MPYEPPPRHLHPRSQAPLLATRPTSPQSVSSHSCPRSDLVHQPHHPSDIVRSGFQLQTVPILPATNPSPASYNFFHQKVRQLLSMNQITLNIKLLPLSTDVKRAPSSPLTATDTYRPQNSALPAPLISAKAVICAHCGVTASAYRTSPLTANTKRRCFGASRKAPRP